MDITNIILLAIIQGLTEFLPISSSAHLILFPHLTGEADQGLAFDVATHVGSLCAILFYFRNDLRPLLGSFFHALWTRQQTAQSRLVWGVGLGTIPVGIVGLSVAMSGISEHLRHPLIIAAATIVFGLLLWWADASSKRERDEYQIQWRDVMWIGLAQALAVIPGTSRSGITMTAALFCGLQRRAAARFSFLLAIPVILLAGLEQTLDLITQNIAVDWTALMLGVLFSAVSAWVCIRLFVHLLDRIGMLPFVIYRLLLGVFLVGWFFWSA